MFRFADIAMTPVKLWPRSLLDDEKSQSVEGTRAVVRFIKCVGNILSFREKVAGGMYGQHTQYYGQ